MAEAAAAGRQGARHARRHRAVHDGGEGQPPRRYRDRPADPAVADLGVPRPCDEPRHPARDLGVRRGRHAAVRDRRRVRVLRRAARRGGVPHQLRRLALQHPDPGELLPVVHVDGAARLRARVRDADLHPGARAHRRAVVGDASPQPPHRHRADGLLRDPVADRRPGLAALRDDPAADPVRVVDLAVRADGAPLGGFTPLHLGRTTTTAPRTTTAGSTTGPNRAATSPPRSPTTRRSTTRSSTTTTPSRRSSASRTTATWGTGWRTATWKRSAPTRTAATRHGRDGTGRLRRLGRARRGRPDP